MSRPAGADGPARRVDYDRIAPSYDRRFATDDLNGVLTSLRALAGDSVAERVLEVGCGTGRWLADLASEGRQLCGLDLSIGMLQQARGRERGLDLVRGKASRIPFPDGVFDLVVCVNAIHHFEYPRAFISEAHRLLAPDGALVVVGSDPHDDRGSWYVYDYFPGTRETDLQRFPSWGTVLDWMATEGFEDVTWQVVRRIQDDKVGTAVMDDPFLQKNACSQLALLSDEAYAAGLRRIASALEVAAVTGEPVTFPVDIHIAALVGRSPSEGHRRRVG